MTYDPRVRTAAGNRRRLRDQATGMDDPALARAARAAAELACLAGRHRTETDAETGDEVCRHCTQVIE